MNLFGTIAKECEYKACWVVVFSPQIIENFKRSSAEGLSIEFIIIWLAGDFANIIGAVMQGVLPTMVSSAFFEMVVETTGSRVSVRSSWPSTILWQISSC